MATCPTIEPFFAGIIVDTGDVSGITASLDQVHKLLIAPTRYRVLSPFKDYFGEKQNATGVPRERRHKGSC